MATPVVDTPGRMDAAVIIKMTDEMRDDFKSYCEARDTTMSEAIRVYIARTLARASK